MKTVFEQVLAREPKIEIKVLRQRRIADIAREIGYNNSYIYQIARREKKASPKVQLFLANSLRVPIAELFDENGMARIADKETF